jgi:enoyl-CoA hydratase/carnithine racemase
MDMVEVYSKPTIAMIRGFCVGGGCELALACDLRIAAKGSKFGITPAKLGIAIGYEEIRRMVAEVGIGNTQYILLSGRLFDDQDALRMGIINQLLEPDELESFTYKLAADIAANAPVSHRTHKRMLQTVITDPGLKGLTEEEEGLPLAIFDTEDYQEGVRAFLGKRRPNFQGK